MNQLKITGGKMKEYMPLKRVVVEVTHEAHPGKHHEIRKAIRAWHNRLFNGSIPRGVVVKLGRELFLDLDSWERWLKRQKRQPPPSGPGRPRTK